MKTSAVIILILMPLAVMAQNYPGMNEAETKIMMQGMQKMQSCMEKIDQSEMKALEQRSQQVEAEIRSLCKAGKRDAAQKKATVFGKETANNPAVQAMAKCGRMMEGAMKDMMPQMPYMQNSSEEADYHVCDQ